MAIENNKVVDNISIDPNGYVVLSISDHLEWDINNDHIFLLQDKINAYLSFIESGQLYEDYPKFKNKKIIIQVFLKYLPNEEGRRFLQLTKDFLVNNGYNFTSNLDFVE